MGRKFLFKIIWQSLSRQIRPWNTIWKHGQKLQIRSWGAQGEQKNFHLLIRSHFVLSFQIILKQIDYQLLIKLHIALQRKATFVFLWKATKIAKHLMWLLATFEQKKREENLSLEVGSRSRTHKPVRVSTANKHNGRLHDYIVWAILNCEDIHCNVHVRVTIAGILTLIIDTIFLYKHLNV